MGASCHGGHNCTPPAALHKHIFLFRADIHYLLAPTRTHADDTAAFAKAAGIKLERA